MKTLTLLIAASTLSAATVTFDALAPFASVTNQYAGVTFSAPFGSDVQVMPYVDSIYGTSAPNAICSVDLYGGQCVAQMRLSFASPVISLSFIAAAIENPLSMLSLSINSGAWFDIPMQPGSGAGYVVTQYNTGQPYGTSGVTVALTGPISTLDFAAYADPAGLVFDDFEFGGGGEQPTGVPEPSTLALMGAALVAMRMVRR